MKKLLFQANGLRKNLKREGDAKFAEKSRNCICDGKWFQLLAF
jgi:hypothetical protein